MATSTWKGGQAAKGLRVTGNSEAFRKSILSEKERYPNDFVRLIEKRGVTYFLIPKDLNDYFPKEIVLKDREISNRLGNQNRPENSIKMRILSDWHTLAFIRFTLKNPFIIMKKFLKSYILFWQPIRNYGRQYVALFFVNPVIENSFKIASVLNSMASGLIPEPVRIMTGKYRLFFEGQKANKKTDMRALIILPTLILLVNIFSIHIIPLILILLMVTPKISPRAVCPLKVEHLFILMIILYTSVVCNLIEYGENMRFRLDIEPLIWIISLFLITKMIKSIVSYQKVNRASRLGM